MDRKDHPETRETLAVDDASSAPTVCVFFGGGLSRARHIGVAAGYKDYLLPGNGRNRPSINSQQAYILR